DTLLGHDRDLLGRAEQVELGEGGVDALRGESAERGAQLLPVVRAFGHRRSFRSGESSARRAARAASRPASLVSITGPSPGDGAASPTFTAMTSGAAERMRSSTTR